MYYIIGRIIHFSINNIKVCPNMIAVNNIKLKRINLLVAKYCNLRCRMCDYRINTIITKQLSFEQISTLLNEAADMGLELLELSGGEPMTRKDIFDIINLSRDLKVKTLMMTNGVLIDEKQAKNLVDCGLNGVVISLEGFEELNDKLRGQGSYIKALNAIKYFQKYADKMDIIKVGITLSKYNYQSINQFIKYLVEEIGVRFISINPFNGNMLYEKNLEKRKEEFEITQYFIPYLKDELEKLIAYSKEAKIEIPPENYLMKIPRYFLGESMVPELGCSEPVFGCSIDSNGGVYPCWGDPVKTGNIKVDSIKNIISSDLYMEFCNNAADGKCKGCLAACHSHAHTE